MGLTVCIIDKLQLKTRFLNLCAPLQFNVDCTMYNVECTMYNVHGFHGYICCHFFNLVKSKFPKRALLLKA